MAKNTKSRSKLWFSPTAQIGPPSPCFDLFSHHSRTYQTIRIIPSHFGPFWTNMVPFQTILALFGPFCLFWANSGSFAPLWLILVHFGPFWVMSDYSGLFQTYRGPGSLRAILVSSGTILDHFRLFQAIWGHFETIQNHFGSFWINSRTLGKFGSFCIILEPWPTILDHLMSFWAILVDVWPYWTVL